MLSPEACYDSWLFMGYLNSINPVRINRNLLNMLQIQLSVNLSGQYRSLRSSSVPFLKIINVKQLNGNNKCILDPDIPEIYKHASYQPFRRIMLHI